MIRSEQRELKHGLGVLVLRSCGLKKPIIRFTWAGRGTECYSAVVRKLFSTWSFHVFLIRVCYLILACPVVDFPDDWPRFRGPSGAGIAFDSESIPSRWDTDQHLAWKVALPGPGASSPIIVGQKVFVTSYSGYGLERGDPGELENLVRHLVCFDLQTGEKLWQQDIPAVLPEDPYDQSGVSSHGYASHTPVSDGTQVYCFFGKSGVHAFDLEGKALWSAEVGKGSDPPRWGSSSSPVVYGSTLVVTAAAESQSIIGLDTSTGRRIWQYRSKGLDGMWGTPSLVRLGQDRVDLVLLVPGELWGFDPKGGTRRWQVPATTSQQAYTSVLFEGQRVFAFSGQGGGSLAVDIDPHDVEPEQGTSLAWASPVAATYATPVVYNSKIYVVSKGILSVLEACSGKQLEKRRLKGTRRLGNARFGSLDYASPVVVDQRLFWLNASGQVFVFQLADKTELVAVNDLGSEGEVFWGTPAVSNGHMLLRSSRFLYCIAGETESP